MFCALYIDVNIAVLSVYQHEAVLCLTYKEKKETIYNSLNTPHFNIFSHLLICFWERVSHCSTGWPQTLNDPLASVISIQFLLCSVNCPVCLHVHQSDRLLNFLPCLSTGISALLTYHLQCLSYNISSCYIPVVINNITTGCISTYTNYKWNCRLIDCQYSWCRSSNLPVSWLLHVVSQRALSHSTCVHIVSNVNPFLIASPFGAHWVVFLGFSLQWLKLHNLPVFFHVACLLLIFLIFLGLWP